MSEYNWKRLFRAPGGHTYFKDTITGQIALADDSGPTPDTTDDGVCWVDMARSMIANCNGFHVPIINKMTYGTTPCSAYEAVKVCAFFGVKLSVEGKLFSLEKSDNDDQKNAGSNDGEKPDSYRA